MQIPYHQAHALERPRRHRARRPSAADGGRQHLVSRRLEERAARPHRLRAPVRAPDVRRLRASRSRLLPAAAARRRAAQRIDQRRSHQLLGSGADRRARSGAVDGIRSHGLPAAGAHRAEVQQPARRRAERAAPELREPAVRPGRHRAVGGDVSAGSSVSLADDRIGRGHPRRRRSIRCASFSRPTITPPTRRCRWPATSRPSRPSSSPSSTSASLPAGPDGRSRCAPRRALAESANLVLEDRVELPRLYLSWHSPAMFADDDAELDIVADVLAHGKTSRLYKTLVYERRVATDVSAYQHSREMGGMFQIACTAAAGVALPELHTAILDAVAELAARRPDRRRARARHRADRSAVHLPAADDRRLRRQGRSAERLQHCSSAIPATSTPIASATST